MTTELRALTAEELQAVNGGAWDWSHFSDQTIGGIITGRIGEAGRYALWNEWQ